MDFQIQGKKGKIYTGKVTGIEVVWFENRDNGELQISMLLDESIVVIARDEWGNVGDKTRSFNSFRIETRYHTNELYTEERVKKIIKDKGFDALKCHIEMERELLEQKINEEDNEFRKETIERLNKKIKREA